MANYAYALKEDSSDTDVFIQALDFKNPEHPTLPPPSYRTYLFTMLQNLSVARCAEYIYAGMALMQWIEHKSMKCSMCKLALESLFEREIDDASLPENKRRLKAVTMYRPLMDLAAREMTVAQCTEIPYLSDGLLEMSARAYADYYYLWGARYKLGHTKKSEE